MKAFIIHVEKKIKMFNKCIFPLYAAVLLNACSYTRPTDKKGNTGSLPDMAQVYRAMTLKRVKAVKKLILPSELKPYEAAMIFSKVNGFVKERKVDIGSDVRKGDVLAIIDAPELKSKLDEALAKIETARSKYLTSKDTYDRIKASARTPGAIAPNELEKTKNKMLSDSAAFMAARYNYNAILDLNHYLLITSPFNGTVTVRNVDVGDIVGPHSLKPMFEVEMNRTLRLRVPVPESMVGNTLISKEIKFSVPAYPGEFFTARFARNSHSLAVDTRSEIWEFDADNETGHLLPGMYADAILKMVTPKRVFVVPKSSVITTLERNFVICIHNGVTKLVNVSDGISVGNKIEIFGKVRGNDTVLVNGNDELKDGMKVKFQLSGK